MTALSTALSKIEARHAEGEPMNVTVPQFRRDPRIDAEHEGTATRLIPVPRAAA